MELWWDVLNATSTKGNSRQARKMLSYPGPPTTTPNNMQFIRSCCKLSCLCHEDNTLQTHVNHLLAVLMSSVSDTSRTTRLANFLFGGVVSNSGETTSMTRDFHWEQKFGQQHDLYKILLEIEFEIAMDNKVNNIYFYFRYLLFV